jgi:tRNA(fMet)-specific endonuclease VapC
MSGKFLLDTNIVIAIFANDLSVNKELAKADEVFIPSVVLGELFYGAFKSSRIDENIERINEFANNSSVLVCDTSTSKQYGKIKNSLRLKGTPIPENDIWIASIAKANDLTLVSRDDHFKEIDRLLLVEWQ